MCILEIQHNTTSLLQLMSAHFRASGTNPLLFGRMGFDLEANWHGLTHISPWYFYWGVGDRPLAPRDRRHCHLLCKMTRKKMDRRHPNCWSGTGINEAGRPT